MLCYMYNEAQPQLQPQRKRGRANYDKHSFYTVKLHPVRRRGCDWRRRGDTHKRTQPLRHKSFPYWHDWLRRNKAVRKRWMRRRRQYRKIQGDQFWDAMRTGTLGLGGTGALARQRPVRRMKWHRAFGRPYLLVKLRPRGRVLNQSVSHGD